MKNILLYVALLGLCHCSFAQFVTIPDKNFRKYLLKNLPECFNAKNELDTTCSKVDTLKNIDFSFEPAEDTLFSLDGIQYFNSLEGLYCPWRKGLKELPPLPKSLLTLVCPGNQLTQLPPLPNTIRVLDIGQNKISSLFKLPDSLRDLRVYNNQLTKLWLQYPANLWVFIYAGNPIKEQPTKFHDKIVVLDCSNTGMTELPSLPKNLANLSCADNKIKCFPRLPERLSYLFVSKQNSACIPNKPEYLKINSYRDNLIEEYSMPVCDAVNNAKQCFAQRTISGYVFFDDNKNNAQDPGERVKEFAKICVGTDHCTFSNKLGYYAITLDSLVGTHHLDVAALKHYTVHPNKVDFTWKGEDISWVQNISLQKIDSIKNMKVQISTVYAPIRGWGLSYQIDYENTGTQDLEAKVFVKFDQKNLNYSSVSDPSVKISRTYDTLLLPKVFVKAGEKKRFTANFSTNWNDGKLDTIVSTAVVMWDNGQDTDTSTSYIKSDIFPQQENYATPKLSIDEIQQGKYVDYNVFYGYNRPNFSLPIVIIKDSLSDLLDVKSLEVIASSHNCNPTLKNHKLYLAFHDSIPIWKQYDFTDYGFIRFRAKPSASVVAGDSIVNYFAQDNGGSFIFWVYGVTKITGAPVAVQDMLLSKNGQLYPNPSEGSVSVSNATNLQILDAQGQLLMNVDLSSPFQTIDLSTFHKGMYFYRMDYGNIRKLVLK